MGLDLVVEGCARPGYETEWRQILERSFNEEPAQSDEARFGEISIPPHEIVGAPRVGYDKAADDWIIDKTNATTAEEVAAVLQEFQGYYVLPLVKSDGIPIYTHAGLYEGVDETSFRGAFLADCTDVLTTNLIEEAWEHKFPEDAITYGRRLLDAADRASKGELPPVKESLLSRLRLTKKAVSSTPLAEQIEIVRTAGKWFVFWGERGHAIRAWF